MGRTSEMLWRRAFGRPLRYAVRAKPRSFYPARQTPAAGQEHSVGHQPASRPRQRPRDSLEAAGRRDNSSGRAALLHQPTAVPRRFPRCPEVRDVYYPGIAALVARLLDAEKVLVFGGRSGAQPIPKATGGGRKAAGLRYAWTMAKRTVRQFTHDRWAPRKPESWLQREGSSRMNVWRPHSPADTGPPAAGTV